MIPARFALAFALSAAQVTPAAAAGPPAELPDPRWRAFQSGALAPDRLQHASLAFTSGVGAGLVTRRTGTALLAGMSLGVAKELLDMRTNGFDWGDLAADFAGAGLAALVTASLDR